MESTTTTPVPKTTPFASAKRKGGDRRSATKPREQTAPRFRGARFFVSAAGAGASSASLADSKASPSPQQAPASSGTGFFRGQAGRNLARRTRSSAKDTTYDTPKRPASRPTRSMSAPTTTDPKPQDAEPQKRWRPQASPPSRASASTMESATGDAADAIDRSTRSSATVRSAWCGNARAAPPAAAARAWAL